MVLFLHNFRSKLLSLFSVFDIGTPSYDRFARKNTRIREKLNRHCDLLSRENGIRTNLAVRYREKLSFGKLYSPHWCSAPSTVPCTYLTNQYMFTFCLPVQFYSVSLIVSPTNDNFSAFQINLVKCI